MAQPEIQQQIIKEVFIQNASEKKLEESALVIAKYGIINRAEDLERIIEYEEPLQNLKYSNFLKVCDHNQLFDNLKSFNQQLIEGLYQEISKPENPLTKNSLLSVFNQTSYNLNQYQDLKTQIADIIKKQLNPTTTRAIDRINPLKVIKKYY